jgi:hypothetical protein
MKTMEDFWLPVEGENKSWRQVFVVVGENVCSVDAHSDDQQQAAQKATQ